MKKDDWANTQRSTEEPAGKQEPEEPGLKYRQSLHWIQVYTNYSDQQEVNEAATQETELKNTK